jgi:HAD superfamily hydrolase (TIGR01509 family)
MGFMPVALPVPWNYRCVAFDLDGVLVDTEPVFEQAVSELLRDRGLVLTPELAHRMLGTPTMEAFEYLRGHFALPEPVAQLANESIQRLFALFDREPPPLLPGVTELLERLERRGVPVAIATSSHREHVDKVLCPHDLLRCFSFVMTCEDVVRGKPDPEIYRKTASRFGHPPADMVVLEDSPNGLRSAKGAGARCVVIPHARVPLHDIGLADAVVDSLAADELAVLLGLG